MISKYNNQYFMRYQEIINKINEINIINFCWYTMKLILFIYNKIYIFYCVLLNNLHETFHITPYIRNTIVVKNSKIIYECNYKDIIYFPELDYDYALYKHQTSNGDYKFIKLINHLDYIVNIQNLDTETFSSNISFIHITLQILDANLNIIETHDITSFFKNSNESYYVVDAELFTVPLMNWLFISYIKKENTKENTKYNIKILDHNIKEIILSENQHIKLHKTSYEIISL